MWWSIVSAAKPCRIFFKKWGTPGVIDAHVHYYATNYFYYYLRRGLVFWRRLRCRCRRRVVVTAATPGERRQTSRHDTVAVARILLVLDASILEPDLDLFLGQTEGGGDLDSTQTGEVHAGGELVFETQ